MDCRTARQILELADAQRGDPAFQDPVRAGEAAAHAGDCGECRGVLRFRHDFDHRLAAVCRDVPVPHGLKDRLLQRLQEAQHAELDHVPTAASLASVREDQPASERVGSRSRRSSRTWLKFAVSAAACMLIGMGLFWYWAPSAQSLVTVQQLEAQVVEAAVQPAGLKPMSQFADGTRPRLPRTLSLPNTARITAARQMHVGGQTVAVYFFSIPTRRSNLEGRLIVVPRRAVGTPPSAEAFLLGPVSYQGRFCSTAWVEGDLTFVCALTGGEGELHRLIPRHEAS